MQGVDGFCETWKYLFCIYAIAPNFYYYVYIENPIKF